MAWVLSTVQSALSRSGHRCVIHGYRYFLKDYRSLTRWNIPHHIRPLALLRRKGAMLADDGQVRVAAERLNALLGTSHEQ